MSKKEPKTQKKKKISILIVSLPRIKKQKRLIIYYLILINNKINNKLIPKQNIMK